MIFDYELTLNDRTQMLLDEVLDREPMGSESIENIKKAINRSLDAQEIPLFTDGLAARLTQLGCGSHTEDTKAMRKELDRRYREILGKECPKAVHNWINGGVPGTDGRINNYDVCWALEMDVRQTGTFMQKYFLTQPFNCKNRIDAIYLYCFYHRKPYALVKELLDLSEGFVTQEKAHSATSRIEAAILSIDNDDTFKKYLSEHCYGKDQQFQLARKIIDDDVEIIKDRIKPDRKGDGRLNNKIIESIYNRNYQSDGRSRGRKRKLPKRFTESLPNDVTLGKILNGDEATYETIRKTMILFRFYSFYSNEDLNNYDPVEANGNLLDFLSEINDDLMRCGFAQIYMCHPFDCLIMYCANSDDPVQAFWNVCEYGWNQF